MEYSEGRIGRVFAARLTDGEAVYECIESLAAKEGVESAFVVVIGGARSGSVVVGPESPTGPVVPRVKDFDDARDLMGVGTIFPSDEGPKLHFHAGIGSDEEAIVGCPRFGLDTWLVLEVVVVEMLGLAASRRLDPESGLKLLRFLAPRK